MRLCIESGSHLRLARLAPAFGMTVTATRGTSVMRRDGFARTLVPGVPCMVAPFQAVDLLVAGSMAQPARCRIDIALASATTGQLALHHELSRRIFLQPELPWTATFAATLLGESPDRIRRTLFAEGAAFGELCRTQRLMRALFESQRGRAVSALKCSLGWPPGQDLEMSFHDRFGITLDLLRQVAAVADETPLHLEVDGNRAARAASAPTHHWAALSPA